MAFFPGVGVADEEVVEAEWACGFFRCDEAVDGLVAVPAQVVVRVMVRVASG